MRQNIYDNDTFFNGYHGMRTNNKGMSANDLIEIPTIRSMIPDLTGKKVLDLGCGYGENAKFFIEKGASYVLGTDISENMINIANEGNKLENVDFKILAMEDIANLDEKFDVVISSLSVHYVEDYEKLLTDIYNILNDGGMFIYSQEHPIQTGNILNKECNGSDKINLGDKQYYLVSDYNRNGKRIVDWNNCDVVKYHRNFSYIINTIIKTKFKIDEILEPVPTEELLKIQPKYVNQFNRPYFLFIKMSKNIDKI